MGSRKVSIKNDVLADRQIGFYFKGLKQLFIQMLALHVVHIRGSMLRILLSRNGAINFYNRTLADLKTKDDIKMTEKLEIILTLVIFGLLVSFFLFAGRGKKKL